MTLSSDARPHVAPGRSGRVMRGHAVEHALPARLGVDQLVVSPAPKSQTPGEQLESARQAAYDEGFQAGIEAARLDAERSRDAALLLAARALQETAAGIQAGRVKAIGVLEEDATTLALELTRTLVDHELSVSDEVVSPAIRRALRLTAPGEELVVRLHPDELIDSAELEPLVNDCRITVVADESIEAGGCVIDAGPCRIDAQIESALARVRWALLQTSRPSDSGDPEPPPAPVRERVRTQP